MAVNLYQWNITLFNRRHTILSLAETPEQAYNLALAQTNNADIKSQLEDAIDKGHFIKHESPHCFILSEWAHVSLMT